MIVLVMMMIVLVAVTGIKIRVLRGGCKSALHNESESTSEEGKVKTTK